MKWTALSISALVAAVLVAGSADADDGASPIFGVRIPDGYRRWEVVTVSHPLAFDELRAIVGNSLATKAYRDGALPFPDGAILVKLAWKRVPSAEAERVFVTGPATTVQVMVKDSKKFAATGGWGFGEFIAGKPVDEAHHQRCFACHEARVKQRDFVFTRFAH